jgi:hypothetical protein
MPLNRRSIDDGRRTVALKHEEYPLADNLLLFFIMSILKTAIFGLSSLKSKQNKHHGERGDPELEIGSIKHLQRQW